MGRISHLAPKLALFVLLLSSLGNAQTAVWTAAGNMTTARSGHTATRLQDGTVLVAGGTNGAVVTASAEIYNPTTNSWAVTGSMANPRTGHTATLLSDGRVLVVGGGAGATAELYDPNTATWTATGSLNASRQGQTASLLQNGMVLVAGGCCTATNVPGYAEPISGALTSSELWNPTTGQWTLTGNMVNMHAYHTANVLSSGTVLVAGGTSLQFPPGPETVSGAEIYDPTSGTWTAVGSLIAARYFDTASLLINDQVLVAGGNGGGCCSGLSSAELYGPIAQAWQEMPAMSAGAYEQAAAVLPGGTEALVSGGYTCCSSPNPTSTTAAIFNITTETWSQTASMSQARYAHTLTTLNDGTVLAVGGMVSGGGTVTLASAERFYNGAAPPEITISSNVATMDFTVAGTGCVAGSYITPQPLAWTSGASCTVTIFPPSPYVFTSWSDGSTANPRTFVAPASAATYSFNVSTASKPGSIMASGGTPQSTPVSTAFANPLVVTVQDSKGNPVSAVTVTFTAPASGASGTFAGGVNTAITNSSGVATSTLFSANATAGTYTVSASVGGVSRTARFTLTNQASSAASITATGGTPQSTTTSTAFSSLLVVTVRNSAGNPVSGVTVTFTAPGSGASGSFAGGAKTARTNAAGVATSAIFSANATVGSYTVTAKVTGVSTPASFALTNTMASGGSGRHHGN
jgi:Galactose oxidase, central domain